MVLGGKPGVSAIRALRFVSCWWTAGSKTDTAYYMRPLDIQQIGEELAIKWDDGSENFVRLEKLRRCCPCAGCKGESDILGNVYRNPERPLPAQAFELWRIANVGGYAIQPVWGDGHTSGLYSFEYLRKVAEVPDAEAE
jgi:DUF971 family protein